jgi:hypothetical protein
MKKTLLALCLMALSAPAFAGGDGACGLWENPSVMADAALDDLLLVISSDAKPA